MNTRAIAACLKRPACIAALLCAMAAPSSGQEVPRAVSTPSAAAASSAPQLPESIPLRRDRETSSDNDGAWRVAALFILVLAAGGVLMVLRHRAGKKLWPLASPGSGPRALERLSSQALTPQGSVHVVRWHDEELLVGCTAQHVTLLSRRPAAALPKDNA